MFWGITFDCVWVMSSFRPTSQINLPISCCYCRCGFCWGWRCWWYRPTCPDTPTTGFNPNKRMCVTESINISHKPPLINDDELRKINSIEEIVIWNGGSRSRRSCNRCFSVRLTHAHQQHRLPPTMATY